MLDMICVGWGDEDDAFSAAFAKQFQPDGDADHLRSWCELQRKSATPEQAAALTAIMFDIDIQTALRVIACPTLVAHANRDAVVPIEEGRLLAGTIPGARFLELDTANHFMRPGEPAWKTFVEALHDFLPAPDPEDSRFGELSPREREVLALLARGLGNAEIAQELGISEKTVRNHVWNMFGTLGVNTRAQAIVAARDAGFGRATATR